MADKKLKRILLVEDEQDIRKIVQVALENLGNFEVATCDSGKEALKLIKSYQPDLLILDVMMPIMDGQTTLQEIRKMDPLQDIPVIFLTAKVQSHEIEHYIELGVIGVISKPFDPLTLASQVNELWNKLEMV